MHAGGVPQALVVALLALCPALAATSKAPSWLDQSWYFDWTPPGAPLPVPITAQCETIHITWSRQTATGPDPVAPYYLHIFTSNFVFPFVVSAGSNPETYLTIPFVPGTEYEICMFDSNNSTGGCQAVYSVYPNTTTSTPPSCANLTMPANALQVLSEYSPGKLSQFGWVDSCSDIRVTPQEGTPPFTFTVAPALHPPLHIISNDMSPINWTVALSWGSPFFISLVDSTGLSWSNGPIHSGHGDTSCLSKSRSGPPISAIVGSAVGGAVLGAIASLLLAFQISKRRKGHSHSDKTPTPFYAPYSPHSESQGGGQYTSLTSRSSPPRITHESLPSFSGSLHELHDFRVEPFVPEPSRPPLSHSDGSDSMSGQGSGHSWREGSDARTHVTSPTSPTAPGGNQVYVIHHDSGRAPVSVITSHGTQVVELPPGYSSNYLPSPGRGGQDSPSASRQQDSPSASRRHDKSASGAESHTQRSP